MTASTSHPGTRATRAARAQAWTLGGVLVGGLAAVTLLAPGSHHYVTCPSLAVGIACPGCGGLRAAESLTHGDVATAWSYNPLVVLGILAALALVIRWIVDARAGREPWEPSGAMSVAVAACLVGFWVLRNVPPLSPYLGPLALPGAA